LRSVDCVYAVGAEHGDELAAADGEVDAAPEDAAADPDRGASWSSSTAQGPRAERGLVDKRSGQAAAVWSLAGWVLVNGFNAASLSCACP
jgi:hypothetical protein